MSLINNKVVAYTTVFLCLFVVACSSAPKDTLRGKVSKKKSKLVITKKPAPMLRHIHPQKGCIEAIIHKHANGDMQHEHNQSCENKVRAPTNAHSHKANNATGSLRHVHPNGNKKHSHHR